MTCSEISNPEVAGSSPAGRATLEIQKLFPILGPPGGGRGGRQGSYGAGTAVR